MLVRVPNALPKSPVGGNSEGLTEQVAGVLGGFQVGKGSDRYPILLDMDKGIPFNDVKKAKPDEILALQQEISESDYKKLSEIAPVVAYHKSPNPTSEHDVTFTTGKALGQLNHAKELLMQTDATAEENAKKFPDIVGKTVVVAQLSGDASKPVLIYPERDIRTQTVATFGFKPAPSLSKAPESKDGKPVEWPKDKADDLQSDVLITFAKDDAEAEAIKNNPSGLLRQKIW